MTRGTRAAWTTEILPVAGAVAVVLLLGGLMVWLAGGEQALEPVEIELSMEPSDLGSALNTPVDRFPGPLAVGVELEEDTTHAECVRVADFYGLGDVEATGDLTVHNGEYIWTYPSFTCWVSVDGELFLTGVEKD